jgi:hypothetical protein
MTETLQRDCYAALWCALFSARHTLDRYADQGELFSRDREPTAPGSATWHDPDDAADPGLNDPPAPGRPRPRALHEPDAAREADNRQNRVDLGSLDLGPQPGPMLPGIERDPGYNWIPRTSLHTTKQRAYEILEQKKRERGFHAGEVVPAGEFWRVNHLYRFPHVQYP